MKTDRELVDLANELARQFYAANGYEVPEGYEFQNARHPQERGMWNLAVIAYEFIDGTDIEAALAEVEAEGDTQQ